MPVRYDIAAQAPQVQGGGFDPMNMLAQYQQLGLRQQQNALAQLQMQKLQEELQQQNALRSSLSNLDITSPAAIDVLSRGGNLSEALQVQQAQRQSAALRAQEAAHQATATYHTGVLNIQQQKLPIELETLQQQRTKEERLAKSAELTGTKTSLENDAATLQKLENLAAKVYNTGGKGYEALRQEALKHHDVFGQMLPEAYDQIGRAHV